MELNHIGIAVRSIEERLELWRNILGQQVVSIEEVPDQKVRVAMLESDGVKIELLEPTADDGPIARFIKKQGEGLHHLSFQVEDIAEKIEELKKKNVKLIDEVPRKGAHGSMIAFIHPTSTGSVLIELRQEEGNNKEV
jgi:methylmalonyl-CoA/ethylmalonyl-CoA epimerase